MMRARGVSRREFLQTAGAVAGGVAAAAVMGGGASDATPGGAGGAGGVGGAGRSVRIVMGGADPVVQAKPVQWAAGWLRDALAARGVAARVEAVSAPGTATKTVNVAGGGGGRGRTMLAALGADEARLKVLETVPESFALARLDAARGMTAVVAQDARGLVYALTELADRVRYAADPLAALDVEGVQIESPVNGYRGMVRLFTSEFQDKKWFYDREGWEKYFDLLVTQRFNRFNLSFGLSYDFSNNLTDTYSFFLYPFLMNVPGYQVRAIAKGGGELAAEEQKRNLETLKFISEQAAVRGLMFTVGIWTHNYKWNNSPNATYTIEGLNAQTQAPYSRDALRMLIDACPGITGITLRTHGESGVPEGSYDIWKEIMSGITGHKQADGSARVIELDLHGKTMTQQMIDTGATTGMPLIISCKQWAEHMGLPYMQASIREAEMLKGRNAEGLMALSSGTRSFLRYGVGDLLREGRNYKVIHRVWPGTQHVLLWGDPLYAAECGKMGSFAGADGIDYFEPLSFRGRGGSSVNKPAEPDRLGYADATLRTERDWEKYVYTLRLWGRLSYNPEAAPEAWRRALRVDYGVAAGAVETALANASRILPLITTAHDPAAASNLYWPEMYVNQSFYETAGNVYSEVPNPKIFGSVSSLDPQMFAGVNEYVEGLLAPKGSAKISPVEVAGQLEQWADAAGRALTGVGGVAVRRVQIDVAIAAGVGRFFAHKFRAGVLWQLFNVSGHEGARTAATEQYKKARDAWAAVAETAKVYQPNQPFGEAKQLQGHWADRLPAIDADIAGMAGRAANPRTPAVAKEIIDGLVQAIVNPVKVDVEKAVLPTHAAPGAFRPGEALALTLGNARQFDGVRLVYRHIHQGERYATVEMKKEEGTFTGAIPAEYTQSAFGLAYYFELRQGARATMFPGFKAEFTGTPYFVVTARK